MVSLIEQATICQSLEKVAVHVGQEVLMDIGNNIFMIIDNLQGILDHQLRLHPIHV